MTDITPQLISTHWRLSPPMHIEPVEQGTNNRSFFVTANEGRFFLKIYRNLLAGDRLAFEHALLRALDELRLPFAVPVPITSRSGATMVEIDTGEGQWLASLSVVIPGYTARFGDASETAICGEALATLTRALGAMRLPPHIPVPRTFGDLAKAHPLVNDPETAIRHQLQKASMADELMRLMEATTQEWNHRTAGWTGQVIHSDFYPANVMVENHRVTGVVDFEFAGWGVRAMDFATGLMAFGLKRQDDVGWSLAQAFAGGYLCWLPLAIDELAAVPTMLRMRELTSLIHWLGRMQQGITSSADIDERAHRALELHHWLNRHQDELFRRLVTSSQERSPDEGS